MALHFIQAQPTTTGDLVGGGAAGGVISAAIWWTYKAKVDQNSKDIEKKADAKDLEPIKQSVEKIERKVDMLLTMKLQERGEQ